MLKFSILGFLLPAFCIAQPVNNIQLNQVGFYPNGPKKAVITSPSGANQFFLVNAETRDTVFRGLLGEHRKSAYSSTMARWADFSEFDKPGKYYIEVPGTGSSFSFRIAKHIHRELAQAVLKGFYFIRSDIALDPAYAGKWARPAGHPDTAVLIHPSAAGSSRPSGTTISSPGGWYDAGDYNKYIVNSGITMGTLLSAWEDFPVHFEKLTINIPESGDRIPDLVNEIVYNLRWMLTMQDPGDGGVYHKCTNASFDGMVMPGVTKAPRYVVQKSTAATLDFAAVTAQAARVLRKFNRELPGLADSCLKAARSAWKWAVQNPEAIYSQNKINASYDPDITTGEYGDRSLEDEWMWAAAEMFVTIGDKTYLDEVKKRMSQPVPLPGWSQVTMMGYYTMVRHRNRMKGEAILPGKQMMDSIKRMADVYLENSQRNAFGVVMGQSVRDFVWGSNAVAANQAILLINAWRFTMDSKYMDGALVNLDYLLGRNATGYCFVTGAGSRPPMHIHHRPSEADGIADPVPGLQSGGPNPSMQDKCRYALTEPETAFTDDVCSYASNEIAINWNAPLVYLAHAMEFYYQDR